MHDGELLLDGAGRETPWSAVEVGFDSVVADLKKAAADLGVTEQL